MTKVSAPYLYRKRGIYYLQKCIPKDLVPHYGASLLQKSLRTKDRTQAVRISSNLVSALEREWQELRFSVPDGVAASDFLKSGVMQVPTLVEAASTYCDMKGISRDVTNISNGIITTTEAEDETLSGAIVSHVSMMVTRLQEGKNPEVIIQSPTLDALFEVYDEIETEIELTEMGVKVIQTSANPYVVGLLQTHAAEVSDMSKRGMQAVHERMAKQGQ